jgi:hypothetical protein
MAKPQNATEQVSQVSSEPRSPFLDAHSQATSDHTSGFRHLTWVAIELKGCYTTWELVNNGSSESQKQTGRRSAETARARVNNKRSLELHIQIVSWLAKADSRTPFFDLMFRGRVQHWRLPSTSRTPGDCGDSQTLRNLGWKTPVDASSHHLSLYDSARPGHMNSKSKRGSKDQGVLDSG